MIAKSSFFYLLLCAVMLVFLIGHAISDQSNSAVISPVPTGSGKAGPWYKSDLRLNVVNDTPQVQDCRETKVPPRYVELPTPTPAVREVTIPGQGKFQVQKAFGDLDIYYAVPGTTPGAGNLAKKKPLKPTYANAANDPNRAALSSRLLKKLI